MDEQNKLNEEIAEIEAETVENVSRETEMDEFPEKTAEIEEQSEKEFEEESSENAGDSAEMPHRWSGEYVLTEEEMQAFVDNSNLVASKRKTVIQGTLAAVLCVINAISYATGGRKMALFLAIVCAALCGAVFAVPLVTRKHLLGEMKAAAENGNATRISGDGTSLFFGAGEDTLAYTYDKTTITIAETVAIVALSDGQMVCVPKRALDDAGWDELCAHATAK